ncbi:hypothetical protein V6N13_057211 [Hibiscus sabdariffa]
MTLCFTLVNLGLDITTRFQLICHILAIIRNLKLFNGNRFPQDGLPSMLMAPSNLRHLWVPQVDYWVTMKADESWDFKNSLVLCNRFMLKSGGFWKVYVFPGPMVLNEFNAKLIVLKLSTLSILYIPQIAPLLLSDPFPNFFHEHGVKEKRLELEQLQLQVLSTTPDAQLLAKVKVVSEEFHVLLNAEERFFRQKARALSVQEGDKNTAYFHSMVKLKQNKQSIRAIKNEHFIYNP